MKSVTTYLHFDGTCRKVMLTDQFGIEWTFNCALE